MYCDSSNLLKNREPNWKIYLVTLTKQQCSKITTLARLLHNGYAQWQWVMSSQQLIWNKTPISWLFIPTFSTSAFPSLFWKTPSIKNWKVQKVVAESSFLDDNTRLTKKILTASLELSKQTLTIHENWINCWENWHNPPVQLGGKCALTAVLE